MERGIIEELRSAYHHRICEEVLYEKTPMVCRIMLIVVATQARGLGKGIIDRHFACVR